jgi:predicted Zn-dependent protease
MQRVGFDPDLMEKVISVLKAQEKFANGEAQRSGRPTGDTPNWLRTHPSNDQRLAEVRRIANQYSGKYQDAGRARYLQAINGMTFGDSREQGVIRGQDFYHEPLGFTLRTPLNWSIQNATSELSIVADNMQAAVSLRPSPNSKGDHAAAIRSLLQPDQGRTEATKINGLRATNFLGTKQGSPVEATVISLGGADYVFQKLQKPAARGTYDRELREIVASFRALTPADASNAKPYVRTVYGSGAGSQSNCATISQCRSTTTITQSSLPARQHKRRAVGQDHPIDKREYPASKTRAARTGAARPVGHVETPHRI